MEARAKYEQLDIDDTLPEFRAKFALPNGIIYLDGNSLGALPSATISRLSAVIYSEWGDHLIDSWSQDGWLGLPEIIGDKIAQLIGAKPGEVIVCDSTSINLFKVLYSALSMSPDRRIVLVDKNIFPTNRYITQALNGSGVFVHDVRLIDPMDSKDELSSEVAAIVLSHVDFRDGACFDMQELSESASRVGAFSIWDLSHSAGVFPVSVNDCLADFAVGCGYKYLNGGPGAPAYLYVAKRHHSRLVNPVPGWMGHKAPFGFHEDYVPADGVRRMLCGTPPILSMAALEIGVQMLLEADMKAIRERSMALTSLFVERIDQDFEDTELELLSPRDATKRGSHVALSHPNAEGVIQDMKKRGVLGDYRPPDLLRFGFSPLYTRYTDVWDATTTLREILSKLI